MLKAQCRSKTAEAVEDREGSAGDVPCLPPGPPLLGRSPGEVTKLLNLSLTVLPKRVIILNPLACSAEK